MIKEGFRILNLYYSAQDRKEKHHNYRILMWRTTPTKIEKHGRFLLRGVYDPQHTRNPRAPTPSTPTIHSLPLKKRCFFLKAELKAKFATPKSVDQQESEEQSRLGMTPPLSPG